MDLEQPAINQISERVIGCAFRVMNARGIGFLAKVYENPLVHELRRAGLRVSQLQAVIVRYDGVNVANIPPISWSKARLPLN
jgi:GxxExxY protein